MNWIEERFKTWSFDNKPPYIVSETIVDEQNRIQHKVLFENCTKEEAETITEMLNQQAMKEQEIKEQYKRFTRVPDGYSEYKILDNGKLFVEDIPHNSTAKTITDKLNTMHEHNLTLETLNRHLLNKTMQQEQEIHAMKIQTTRLKEIIEDLKNKTEKP